MRGKRWLLVFFVLAGVVVGSLAAELTHDISWLRWLSYGFEFGLTQPFALNLHVMTLTFGLTLQINLSVILFVTLALIVGSRVT